MLHDGARTRFILDFQTQSIAVSFSIRQGDPLSMFLYVIYIEPFLVMLEKKLGGIMMGNIKQILEAFCDDINILIGREEDFILLDKIIEDFESFSAAIISRNLKCKVLGLGRWKNKDTWPLDYLVTENEIKVFGIWVKNSYQEMSARNWAYRLDKLKKSVISWSTRTFDTVLHRIEVLKCFGLSRVYYVASVLPMKARWMKSFNQVMGDFLWRKSGKVLKLPMDEIVNSFGRGGLGLPSIEAMNKSLILTQMFRLMKSDDEKSKMHLNMWLGPVLSDIWVGPAVVDGGMNYEHFNMVAEIVVEAKLHQHINIEVWPILTNKLVYAGFAENFAKTKVERESMQSMDLVWSRLKSLELDRNVQETSFLLVHDKLPVKERVYRIGLARDPYCDSCDAAVFGDTQHYFTQCGQVNTFWR